MRTWMDLAAALAVVALGAAAPGAKAAGGETRMQPPMNTFNDAYYTCDGSAFLISYDSDTPTKATLTTSDHNKAYELTRTDSPTGVAFSAGATKFWTDGKTVTVVGAGKFQNCKRKVN